jgi:hypothetical protein
MAHRRSVGQVPALPADDVVDLGLHQLIQHPEPHADAQRQQPSLRRAGLLAQRLQHRLRQPLDALVAGRDLTQPLPSSMQLVLPSSWTSFRTHHGPNRTGRGRRIAARKFHGPRDKLSLSPGDAARYDSSPTSRSDYSNPPPRTFAGTTGRKGPQDRGPNLLDTHVGGRAARSTRTRGADGEAPRPTVAPVAPPAFPANAPRACAGCSTCEVAGRQPTASGLLRDRRSDRPGPDAGDSLSRQRRETCGTPYTSLTNGRSLRYS